MRDAVGGVVNISLIATFIALISGYMAFNINYTKAFRMKNRVITALELYSGKCNFQDAHDECTQYIEDYRTKIGYEFEIDCKDSPTNYCGKGYRAIKDNSNNDNGVKKSYYKVVTHVTIDIPVVERVMKYIPGFDVTGSTKLITER